MPADLLIFKKRGQKISVKITKGMKNGHTPENYEINVNLKNFKDLALFLSDLKWIHGAPLDKAILEYQESKEDLYNLI